MIGVAFREQRLQRGIAGQAKGRVVALALFILHHAALRIQLGLRHGAKQPAHAIGFQIQRQIERLSRHIFEIVGAIKPGGAVGVRRAHILQLFEEYAVVVLAAIEHQMFEQMGKAGLATGLVFGTDVIPDTDGHDWRLAIGMDDDAQAVGQGELFVRHLHLAHQRSEAGRLGGGHGTTLRQHRLHQHRGGSQCHQKFADHRQNLTQSCSLHRFSLPDTQRQ